MAKAAASAVEPVSESGAASSASAPSSCSACWAGRSASTRASSSAAPRWWPTGAPTQQSSGRTGAPPANDQIGTLRRQDPRRDRGRVVGGAAGAGQPRLRSAPARACSPARRARPAAARSRPWGRSIARSTRRSISTRPSSSEMQRRFGGGGDFAYAYVIAHEVGHHVQNLLGILPKVQQAPAPGRRWTGGEQSVGPGRADGRLPRGRLGQQDERAPEQHRPTRDVEAGPRGGDGDRRRPAAAPEPGHASCRTASRTAPRSSACAGSRPGCARATSTVAIRSRPRSFRARLQAGLESSCSLTT